MGDEDGWLELEDSDPYLYGHDGADMRTVSVAFTSSDGRRQLSVAATAGT